MFSCGAMRCGRVGAKFSCPVARGVGRVVRSRLVSSTWTWEAGGNCTTWGFDTPATRRWKASCSAKPPFGWPGGLLLVGRWIRLGEVWTGVGGCGAFQRPGYGMQGGNCTTWGFDTPATRRWKASCSAKPPFCSIPRRNQVPRRLCSPPMGATNRILVAVRARFFEGAKTGQPRAEAGLPGQRSCAACDCTDVHAMSAFAAGSHEAAVGQPNQTVSITFVARRSSMAA